jgi:hypothetical protein
MIIRVILFRILLKKYLIEIILKYINSSCYKNNKDMNNILNFQI